MGVQQLCCCRDMCKRGKASESGVCVGAEGRTGYVNRAWLPWELMAIDNSRPRNDRSYLAQCEIRVHVCVVPVWFQSLFKSLGGEWVQICAEGGTSMLHTTPLQERHTPPPPSCLCRDCDRLSCEFPLFLTPLSASTHRETKFMCCMQKGTLSVRVKRSLLSLTRGFLQRGRQWTVKTKSHVLLHIYLHTHEKGKWIHWNFAMIIISFYRYRVIPLHSVFLRKCMKLSHPSIYCLTRCGL